MVFPWWCCGLDDSQVRATAANSITIPAIGDDGFAKANEITVWKSVMTAGRVITSCVGKSVCYFVSLDICVTRWGSVASVRNNTALIGVCSDTS